MGCSQGVDSQNNLDRPKVIEAFLGTRLRGCDFARSPLVRGKANSCLCLCNCRAYCAYGIDCLLPDGS